MDLGVPWPRFHGKRDESNQFILVIVKNSIANDNLFKLEVIDEALDMNVDQNLGPGRGSICDSSIRTSRRFFEHFFNNNCEC